MLKGLKENAVLMNTKTNYQERNGNYIKELSRNSQMEMYNPELKTKSVGLIIV